MSNREVLLERVIVCWKWWETRDLPHSWRNKGLIESGGFTLFDPRGITIDPYKRFCDCVDYPDLHSEGYSYRCKCLCHHSYKAKEPAVHIDKTDETDYDDDGM